MIKWVHILTTIIYLTSPTQSTSPPQPPHHFLPLTTNHQPIKPQQSIELTPPLPTTVAPTPPHPECTLRLLHHSFATTYNHPPTTTTYSPPPHCPPPWSSAVLHLSGSVSGQQYDRIAAVWLHGVEILRTSTPEPFDSGTFWNVRKDITRYSSLLRQSNLTLSVMLENIVDDVFTGVIHVNLTLLFYRDEKLGLGLGFGGADLIIPLVDDGNLGFWFRIMNGTDVGTKSIDVPMNAKRIVLELYVSFHGDDEFWYSNPPNSYIEANNLSVTRGNGAYREVFVRVDGVVVSSIVPVPVVFTGGINPLFWEPVVAIGAFDLPSYDFELTPFLGSILNGGSHVFEIGVRNAIQFWLVDANLHVWLDKGLSRVDAKMGYYRPPDFDESWVVDFNKLDGLIEVESVRSSRSSGWVVDSDGNVTTTVVQEMRFKNSIMFQRNGTYKRVMQKLKVKKETRVMSDMGVMVSQTKFEGKYPFTLIVLNEPGSKSGTNLMTTNISIALEQKFVDGRSFSYVQNSQESGGWMLVEDHDVLSGQAKTRQTLDYQGCYGCFSESVEAAGGRLVSDNVTTVCPSSFGNVLNAGVSEW